MSEYPIAKMGLPQEQIEAIVERGAPIPPQYPIGSAGYIGLQLARHNYLLRVRNKYLRFMNGVLIGIAALVIGGCLPKLYIR